MKETKNIISGENIVKSYGNGTEKSSVLSGVSLSVKEGEILSVIGPSGSGKSTLLRCATMLEQMDKGELFYLGEKAAWNGSDGTTVYAKKEKLKEIQKNYGLVFQNFNLFPHMT
ncbi:ATP-binding cassette domain-containing protein, partial [Robinsoniella sp.]|uniref:ATP-binding cassette domain-containing protein n=1 Tax=Robinsoniella sp. TaxID=2496533 RepID=UPI0037522BA8